MMGGGLFTRILNSFGSFDEMVWEYFGDLIFQDDRFAKVEGWC